MKKPTSLRLWFKLLGPEKNFYWVTLVYGSVVGLLSLAIPISVQSLVNTVTFAVFKQPLIIVTLVLLVLLVLSSLFYGLQAIVIEYFQRHFYARISGMISSQLISASPHSLRKSYGADLVNRYFDIMSVQKSAAKLLSGGFSLLLQTIAGLLLLAFYHPYFLAFDLILILLLYGVWHWFGNKAIDSAIEESKAKYKVGAWFEQLVSANSLFRDLSGAMEAKKKTNQLIDHYIYYREKHFKYLFRQIAFLLAIYAFLSALILGLGGFLVMEGQLTLGQLVAAEIVVAVILTSFAKAGNYLEAIYDVHASLDKLADFLSLEQEESVELLQDEVEGTMPLHFDKVQFVKNNNLYYFDFDIQKKKAYLFYGDCDATQQSFFSLVHGSVKPEKGRILLGNAELSVLPYEYIREIVAIVEDTQVFQGSIFNNLTFALESITQSQVNEVLEIVGLDQLIKSLPEGLETQLWPGTEIMSKGEKIRLELARLLLKKPSWVVISFVYHEISPAYRLPIVNAFKEREIGLIVWSTDKQKNEEVFSEIMSFSAKPMAIDTTGRSN